MPWRGTIFLSAFLALFGTACFPGGIVDKGGITSNAGFIPSATMTKGSPYKIVCFDKEEADRREKERADEENHAGDGAKTSTPGDKTAEKKDVKDEPAKPAGGPPVKYIALADYHGGCEEEGETSQFMLLGLYPVTGPLNPDHALGMAVQRLEGDSLVNIRYWHEAHYYSLLGRVHVFKVRGDVIKFLSEAERGELGKKKDKGGRP